jgi:hypothetical protein
VKNDVNVPPKSYKHKNLKVTNEKSRIRYRIRIGSQRYGSVDLDPYQTDENTSMEDKTDNFMKDPLK